MAEIFEFLLNHPYLVTAWAVLFILLIKHEQARGGATLSTQQATDLVNRENAVIVDIRKNDEYRGGHLPNSINIPFAEFDKKLTELEQYKDRPMLLVCKTGTTVGGAGTKLKAAGFDKVYRLQGGIIDWQASKLPLVKS